MVTSRYPRSLPRNEIREGIPVHRYLFLLPAFDHLKAGRVDLLLASLFAGPLTLFRLHRLLRSFQPDVVNVHFPLAQNAFVLWLRRIRPFPLVVSLHGDEILSWFGTGARPFRGLEQIESGFARSPRARRLRTILKECDAVTACSRWLLNKGSVLEPSVLDKGIAIHNGIDPTRFSGQTESLRERPYILALGRLTALKGFDLLLTAFAGLAGSYPGIDLVIGGDGAEQPELVRQATSAGIAKRVFFPGRLDPKAVVQYLNGCLFLVVPSRCEAFGIVALEGLAAGKPVLAADAGGIAEIPGIRIVQPDAESLREGMTGLLNHPPVPVALPVPDGFRWPSVAQQYLAVYKF